MTDKHRYKGNTYVEGAEWCEPCQGYHYPEQDTAFTVTLSAPSADCPNCGACPNPDVCKCCGVCRNCNRIHGSWRPPIAKPTWVPAPFWSDPIGAHPVMPEPLVGWEVTCGPRQLGGEQTITYKPLPHGLGTLTGSTVLNYDGCNTPTGPRNP